MKGKEAKETFCPQASLAPGLVLVPGSRTKPCGQKFLWGGFTWMLKRLEHIEQRKRSLPRGSCFWFSFFQSAAAVVNSLEGAASAVARGLVIWAFVLITIVFYCVKYRALLRRFCRYALRSYLVSYLRLFLSPATASGSVSPYILSTIFVRL